MSESSGIEILAEQICGQPLAAKGSHLTYSARIYLRRGEEVTPDFESIRRYGDRVATTEVDGVQLIEHSLVLGKRRAIAGIERMLLGLGPGSFCEAIIPPHLAYGNKGTGDIISRDAILRVRIWVHTVASAEQLQ